MSALAQQQQRVDNFGKGRIYDRVKNVGPIRCLIDRTRKKFMTFLRLKNVIFTSLAFILIAAFDFHPRHPQAERSLYCSETATTISEVFIAFFLSFPSVVREDSYRSAARRCENKSQLCRKHDFVI